MQLLKLALRKSLIAIVTQMARVSYRINKFFRWFSKEKELSSYFQQHWKWCNDTSSVVLDYRLYLGKQ